MSKMQASASSAPAASQGPGGPGVASLSNLTISTFNVGSSESTKDPDKVAYVQQKLLDGTRALLGIYHVVCLNEVSPKWHRYLDAAFPSTMVLVHAVECGTLVIFHAEAFAKRPAASQGEAGRLCFLDLQELDKYKSWRKWQQVLTTET